MDPYALVLGTLADTFELLSAEEGHGKDEEKQMLLVALGYAMANQLKEKSFLTGFNDLMDAISRGRTAPDMLQRYMNNVATSAIPYSSMQRNMVERFEDPIMREYIDLVDSIKARSYLGDSTYLPPRYTVIVEERT